MEFLLLLSINLAILVLMYLSLRHQLKKNYNTKSFLQTLQNEVNNIMTDLNETAETNVQILNNSADKLLQLKERVEKRITELQGLFAILETKQTQTKIIENQIALMENQTPVEEFPKETDQTRASTPIQQKNMQNTILELYQQGQTIYEIAEVTGMPIGEIRLILEFIAS